MWDAVRAQAGGPARAPPARAAAAARPARRAVRAAERVARPAALVRAVPARGAHDRRRRQQGGCGCATARRRAGRCAGPRTRSRSCAAPTSGQLGELLVDLHQWIAAFDPRSIVELDYGELSDLMSWDEMDDDHSAGHDPARARRALEARAERVRRGLPVGARALGGVPQPRDVQLTSRVSNASHASR